MGFYGSYGDLMFETCELDMLKLKPPTMIQFLSCLWLYHNNTLIWNKNDQPISNENPQVVFWPPSDWNPFAWIPAEQIASSSDPLGPQLCPVRPMTISISIATQKKVYNIEKKINTAIYFKTFHPSLGDHWSLHGWGYNWGFQDSDSWTVTAVCLNLFTAIATT